MRDLNPVEEQRFFELFHEYFDLEKNTAHQHDPANYTLDRMVPLAEAAGHPERKLKIVHVAGTKGKGSTSHFTSALIQASGHNVGLFTSPHLATVRERFQLNNELIPYPLLLEQSAAMIAELKRRNLIPSLFEIFTVLALKIFADAGMEYAVLETGIGGTLDATNYVEHPLCCAITPVSFDHVALLGNTIEEIASQKAGIIVAGVPVCIGKQPYAAADKVITNRAAQLASPVVRPVMDVSEGFVPSGKPPIYYENFALAYAVVKQLGLTPSSAAFRMPQLRARCEVVQREPLVILDASHNADSIRRLVETLQLLYADVHFTVILGSVPGKDIAGIARELKGLAADFILTNPHTPRGSALSQLEAEAKANGLNVVQIIPELISREQLPSDKPLLFTGSFFTAVIGETLFN